LKSAIYTRDEAISLRDAAERRKNIAEDCAAAASSAVKVARQVTRETKAAAATAVKAAQQDVRDVKNESKMLAIQLVKTEKALDTEKVLRDDDNRYWEAVLAKQKEDYGTFLRAEIVEVKVILLLLLFRPCHITNLSMFIFFIVC
jgi:hypothetical protein